MSSRCMSVSREARTHRRSCGRRLASATTRCTWLLFARACRAYVERPSIELQIRIHQLLDAIVPLTKNTEHLMHLRHRPTLKLTQHAARPQRAWPETSRKNSGMLRPQAEAAGSTLQSPRTCHRKASRKNVSARRCATHIVFRNTCRARLRLPCRLGRRLRC